MKKKKSKKSKRLIKSIVYHWHPTSGENGADATEDYTYREIGRTYKGPGKLKIIKHSNIGDFIELHFFTGKVIAISRPDVIEYFDKGELELVRSGLLENEREIEHDPSVENRDMILKGIKDMLDYYCKHLKK